MSFNKAQTIAKRVYGGGDYDHLETLDDCRDVGDTLFTFIMIELDDKEDCDDEDEAMRRLRVAMGNLREVHDAIEKEA